MDSLRHNGNVISAQNAVSMLIKEDWLSVEKIEKILGYSEDDKNEDLHDFLGHLLELRAKASLIGINVEDLENLKSQIGLVSTDILLDNLSNE